MEKLVSVITINLNNKNGLEKTVQSVLSQTYLKLEYIIIDGGSNDGSFEYIQSNRTKLSYFVSENDEGIYAAMNKGILKANGTYLIFLNSGDYFENCNSLENLIGSNPTESIIYGNLMLEKNGKLSLKKYPDRLDINYFSGDTLPHPSTLIQRDLFLKYGLYSLNYKIISDWVFFVDTIISKNVSYKYIDNVVSVFDMNGISSQPGSYKLIKKEMNLYFLKQYPFYFYFSKMRWAIKYYPTRFIDILKAIIVKPMQF